MTVQLDRTQALRMAVRNKTPALNRWPALLLRLYHDVFIINGDYRMFYLKCSPRSLIATLIATLLLFAVPLSLAAQDVQTTSAPNQSAPPAPPASQAALPHAPGAST